MNFTKKQIANLLSDRILFRFSIHTDFIANFNEHEQLFTFDEFEKVVKSNLDYWKSISEKAPNNFYSNWQSLSDKIVTIRQYLSELEEFNLDDVEIIFTITYQLAENLGNKIVLLIFWQFLHRLIEMLKSVR